MGESEIDVGGGEAFKRGQKPTSYYSLLTCISEETTGSLLHGKRNL